MGAASAINILMTADTMRGVWTYASALASSLAASGANVTLVTIGLPPRVDQREMLRGSRTRLIETDLALEWQDPEGNDLAHAKRILAELEIQFRPDIVHLNSFREATFRWSVPTVVVAHSCVNSWALACRDTAWLNEPRWNRYTETIASALDSAQAWVCPSRSFHDDIVKIYHPTSPGAVIWNGIAPGDLPQRKRELILPAGRLWDRAKNIDTLAAAAPGLDWPVHVAGPGGTESPGITWLGQLPQPDLHERLQHAAIFVSPARYEPFGLSVLEAAAAGCALVLSDIPSFRELWSGVALFFDPSDSQALHSILADLSSDDLGRNQLQRRAYEHSLTYSLARTTSAYLKLYEELLPAERASTPDSRIEVRV